MFKDKDIMKSILFGSIGVLVESSEIQRKAFNEAFKEFGLDWYWMLNSKNYNLILNPGDTFSLPKNNKFTLNPTKLGMATLYKVIPTDDKPGPTTRK